MLSQCCAIKYIKIIFICVCSRVLYHELISSPDPLQLVENAGIFVIMAKIRDSDRELQRTLTSYEEFVLSSDEAIQLPTPKVSVSLPLQLAADIFLRLPFDATMDFLVCFLAGVDQ